MQLTTAGLRSRNASLADFTDAYAEAEEPHKHKLMLHTYLLDDMHHSQFFFDRKIQTTSVEQVLSYCQEELF